MILIRPLEATDRPAVAFVFGGLGADSRYQRFLGVRPALTARELAALTRVDHWHHEALIAFALAPRRPLGTARYVRTERFDTAELAVAIADDWQRQGIGGALTRALRERALAAGIRRFIATMLTDNRGADALARGLGRRIVLGPRQGALEIAIELDPQRRAVRSFASHTRLGARCAHARSSPRTDGQDIPLPYVQEAQ